MGRRPERNRNKGNIHDKSHDDNHCRHGPTKNKKENERNNIHRDTWQEASLEDIPFLAIGDFIVRSNGINRRQTAVNENIDRLTPAMEMTCPE